jgi:predicted RNase H-like nuclease
MKKAGISSKDILATLDGDYNDMAISSKQSTSEIYNEMGETMQQKRSNIKKEMRKDPIVGKRLMNMWIRDQKNASKGFNQRDMLMRNMDTDERVDYLTRNPGLINDFRRRDVISDSVIDALRIRGVL